MAEPMELRVAPWEIPVVAANLADVGRGWPEYKAKIEGTEFEVKGMADLPNRTAKNEQDISVLKGDVSNLDSLVRMVDGELGRKADKSDLDGKADKSDLDNKADKNELVNLEGKISNNEAAISSMKGNVDGMKKPVDDWITAMDFFNALPGKYPIRRAEMGAPVTRPGVRAGTKMSLSTETMNRIDSLFDLGSRVTPESVGDLSSGLGDVRMDLAGMKGDISSLKTQDSILDNKIEGVKSDLANLKVAGLPVADQNALTFIKNNQGDLQTVVNNKARLTDFDSYARGAINPDTIAANLNSGMITNLLSAADIEGKISDGWIRAKVDEFAPPPGLDAQGVKGLVTKDYIEGMIKDKLPTAADLMALDEIPDIKTLVDAVAGQKNILSDFVQFNNNLLALQGYIDTISTQADKAQAIKDDLTKWRPEAAIDIVTKSLDAIWGATVVLKAMVDDIKGKIGGLGRALP